MGKCPGCNEWNSLAEQLEPSKKASKHFTGKRTSYKPEEITAIESEREPRMLTDMKEFNRVLGGGVVPGSLILIGGDPGIGKSTILLQISSQLANKQVPVLYVSGEESTQQTQLRADRLDINSDLLYVLAETNLYDISKHISDLKPSFIVIDSNQTIYNEEVTSAPGSVSQVRECTSTLMKIAKT